MAENVLGLVLLLPVFNHNNIIISIIYSKSSPENLNKSIMTRHHWRYRSKINKSHPQLVAALQQG
jgi:hypothetical protein